MTVKYRTVGAWGTGSAVNLTPAEVDVNFYDTSAAVADAEAAAPDAGGISDISLNTDGQLTASLTEGRDFGPWEIPGVKLWHRGAWVASAPYRALDMVKVGDSDLYLVTRAHTSALTFDPQEADSEGPLYRRMLGNSERYDMAVYFPGVPGGYDYQIVAPRPFFILGSTEDEVCGLAYLRVVSAYDIDCDLQKNDAVIGLIHIAAGEHLGEVECDNSTYFAVGDRLSITRPDVPGGEDLSITVNTVRGHA